MSENRNGIQEETEVRRRRPTFDFFFFFFFRPILFSPYALFPLDIFGNGIPKEKTYFIIVRYSNMEWKMYSILYNIRTHLI